MTINLVIDGPLVRTASGLVSGYIYFRSSDGWAFPEHQWSDFPVVVLQWWREAVQEESSDIVLRFMDGPFEVKIRNVDGRDRLTFLQRTVQGPQVIREAQIIHADCIRMILAACNHAAALLSQAGYPSEARTLGHA